MKFWKWESIGNDFPLFHAEDLPTGTDLPSFVQRVSDRHFGIGGDGVLVLSKEESDLRLRMFNPDGTEDFCGNGLRIAASQARTQGWVGDDFVIRHLDRKVPVHAEGDQISTGLGAASYDPKVVPHTGIGELFDANIWSGMVDGYPLSFFGSSLSTGSTHTVIPTVALPDDESFVSVSSMIEVAPLFPDRTSVIWCREDSPNEISIRIWERGVGETQGCGTGSSAAAADYLRRRGRGGTVVVHNPGGNVSVSMAQWNQPLTITGVAGFAFAGTLSD